MEFFGFLCGFRGIPLFCEVFYRFCGFLIFFSFFPFFPFLLQQAVSGSSVRQSDRSYPHFLQVNFQIPRNSLFNIQKSVIFLLKIPSDQSEQ